MNMCYLLPFRKNLFGFIILFALLPSFSARSQDLSQYGWKKNQINQANTAKDCSYLDEEEKMVVLLVNLARIDPQHFGKVMMQMWEENTEDIEAWRYHYPSAPYLQSLQMDLKLQKPLPPLQPTRDLFQCAEIHADKMGEKGQTGHRRNYSYSLSEKMKGLHKLDYNGENCSYGYQKAIDIVMQLLVDDQVKSLGHRKNILYPDFRYIGVATRAHKKYEYNCVMDFR